MNILILTDYFDTQNLAGSTRVIVEVIKCWAKQKDNMVILGGINEKKEPYGFEGAEVHPLFYCGRSGGLNGLLSMRKEAKHKIRDLLKTFHPDFIWAHQPLITEACLSNIKKYPLLYTFHSSWVDEIETRKTSFKNPVTRFIRKKIESVSLKASHRIHTLSQFMYQRRKILYPQVNASRILIPGGVDSSQFIPLKNTQDIRKKFSVPKNSHWIVSARRMVDRTGVDDLIQAIDRIQNDQIHVTIAGKGEKLSEYQSLVKKLNLESKVHLPGYLLSSDLKEMMAGADLFVLPTRELEGFGLVTLEAFASGTPVLATPVGGTSEILKTIYPQGLLQGTGPQAIADGLRQLDWSNLPKEAAQLRERTKELFSWEKMAKELQSSILETRGVC